MASNKVAEYARKLREKRELEKAQKQQAALRKPTIRPPSGAWGGSVYKSTAAAGAAATAAAAARGGGSVSAGPVKLPSNGKGRAAGVSGGSSEAAEKAAKERRAREEMLASHRTPAAAQTFTLDHFTQGVVQWDIFGEIHAESCGKRSAWEEKSDLPNVSVPNTFRSAQEYARVWTPLLVREVRAQTLSELCGGDGWQRNLVMEVRVADSKSMWAGRPELKLTDVHPEFGEPEVGVKLRENKFALSPQCFTEHELILFMVERDAIKTALGGKGQQPPRGFLGVVSSATRSRAGLAVRVSSDMIKRYRPKDHGMHIITLGSLRPTLREYESITGLGRIMLRNHLLSGKASVTDGNLVDNLGGRFVEWMEHKFNDSQKNAIQAGANSQGFTLIKGPPGTGKTTTLKALLNALHQREYNRYYEQLLNLARVAPEDTPAAWDKLKNFAPHILVTAPSNVAVDNIVARILEEGFLDGNAGRYNPSMVRVGSGNVGTQVQPVALQAQVHGALNQTNEQLTKRLGVIRSTLEELKTAINMSLQLLRILLAACQFELPHGWEARVNRDSFTAFFVDHVNQRTTLEPPDPPTPGPGVKTVMVESMPEYTVYAQHMTKDLELFERLTKEHKRLTFALNAKTETRDQSVRQNLEVTLLDEAHLVFSTLNSSGLPCMDLTSSFEVLVVDEAAQSVEVSTIIPLRLGCRHCVLVGDPNQLPATVFSQGGKISQYDRSLFQRLEACQHPVHMLDTQYRMHPTISAFPSSTFYDNELKDGPNVKLPTYTRAFHTHPIFQPFMFFDLTTGHQTRRGGGGSLSNAPEAHLAVNVYLTLKRAFGGIGPKGSGDEHGIAGRVGVISPYAQQIKVLRDKFQEALGHAWQNEVEISTVDAFQGREKDVIIVSTVRAAGSRGIGFLADVRRMNVALTRARHGLFVVGSAAALSVNPKWSELASLAKNRGGLVRVEDPTCRLLDLSPVGKKKSSSSSSAGGATPFMLPFGSKAAVVVPPVGLPGPTGEVAIAAGPGQARAVSPLPTASAPMLMPSATGAMAGGGVGLGGGGVGGTRTVSPVPAAAARPAGLYIAGGGGGGGGGGGVRLQGVSAGGNVGVSASATLPHEGGGGGGGGGGVGGGY